MTLDKATISLSCGCSADILKRTKKDGLFEVKVIKARAGCWHKDEDVVIKDKKKIILFEEGAD